jgi:hypothetical protein
MMRASSRSGGSVTARRRQMATRLFAATALYGSLTGGIADAEFLVRALGDGAAVNQVSFGEWLHQARSHSHALDAMVARIEQDRQAQVTLILRRDTCGFLDSTTQAGGKGRLDINLNNFERLATRQPGDNLQPAWALSPADELAFALQEALVMSLAQLPLDQGAPKEAGLVGANRVREEAHNPVVLAALDRSPFGEDAGSSRDCQASSTYREIRFAGGRYQYVSFDRWGHLHNAFIDLTALSPKTQQETGASAGKARPTSLPGADEPISRAPAPPRRQGRAAAPHRSLEPERTGSTPTPLFFSAAARTPDKPPTSEAARAAETGPRHAADRARSERSRGGESNGGGNE